MTPYLALFAVMFFARFLSEVAKALLFDYVNRRRARSIADKVAFVLESSMEKYKSTSSDEAN